MGENCQISLINPLKSSSKEASLNIKKKIEPQLE